MTGSPCSRCHRVGDNSSLRIPGIPTAPSSSPTCVVDGHVLAELLRGPLIEPRPDDTSTVAALLDWVHVPEARAADGASIAELQLRSGTDAPIVAVLREDRVHPDPGPEFRLHAHDVVVLSAGTSDLASRREMLTAPRGWRVTADLPAPATLAEKASSISRQPRQ